MKKLFSLSILSLFLLISIDSLGFSQKAADILEKMIEAQGGREVLESIKDVTIKVSVESDRPTPTGTRGSVILYKKEPNKMRMDVEATVKGIRGVYIIATDGETAWESIRGLKSGTIGGQMDEEPAKAWKRDSLGYDALLHPEKYGIIYSYEGMDYFYEGREKVEGEKDYFVLEQTFSDGYKKTLYVDSETYLIYKTNGEIKSDYKKVDGVVLAHCSTSKKGKLSRKITFTEVKFNTGLEDSFFKWSK
jgi:outer membrane lipoprotein-sorting protein